MANTTNLDLVPLDGSAKLKNFPTPYNGNLEKIDTAFGNLTTVAYDAIKGQNNVSIGYSEIIGKICVILLQNKNGTFPSTGIELPAKYKADSDYYAPCKYFDGSNDVIGLLFIAYNTSKIYLKSLSNTNVSGTYVAGTLTYFGA